MSESGYPSPEPQYREAFRTKAGMVPINCTLNKQPYQAGKEAFDKAKEYVEKDEKNNFCSVSGTGVVTEWKATNGKVKLRKSDDQNTTLLFTNDLELEK